MLAITLLSLLIALPRMPRAAEAGHSGHEGHGAHAAHGGHPGAELAVGTIMFANSCSDAVQAELARGVAMLHSFWWSAGEAAFRSVLARDPGCAVATWGIASILMNNALAGVGASPPAAAAAMAAIEQGRAIGAKTQRERDYIEAVAEYYRDYATRPEAARQVSRAAAFEALAARYPDDDEAQIFSVVYIAGTQSQADQSFAAYGRAVAILERQLAKHPDHPGITHYLIHSFDAPPIAANGLSAAVAYAKIAPDAPHAQHMPSHIFTRVGAWRESVASNTRAFAAALPGQEYSEAQHASDYMVYANLQLARDAAAVAAMRAAFAVTVPPPVPPATYYARAAMPARIALEREDWAAAAQLPVPAPGQPYAADALTLFARAIGAARSGDVAAAAVDSARLRAAAERLRAAGNGYWAAEVGIQATVALAWTAFAGGDQATGLALMRDAADREDGQEKHIVTPGRLLPTRELLGDMLLAAGEPAAALAAYEMSQVREPNRICGGGAGGRGGGGHGAGRAADAEAAGTGRRRGHAAARPRLGAGALGDRLRLFEAGEQATDGAEACAVMGGRTVLQQCGAVGGGGVAGIVGPGVGRVAVCQAVHGAVADDLGADAGGGDAEVQSVAADAAGGGAGKLRRAVAVDQGVVGAGGEAGDGSAHRQHGRMKDVEAGDLVDRGGAEADLDPGGRAQRGPGADAGGGIERLAVVDQGTQAAGDARGEDDGGGDDGARERTAAGFIDPCDAAAVATLEREARRHQTASRAWVAAAWQGSMTGTPQAASTASRWAAMPVQPSSTAPAPALTQDWAAATRPARAADGSSRVSIDTFIATSAARRDSRPMARRAARWRAFEASTMAMTPKRSARAMAAATPLRKTPRTGRRVVARAASIPGSEAQAMT